MARCFLVITYRPVGAAAGPCPYQRHCTLTVNPPDRNSTGSLVGTSLDGGVGGVLVVGAGVVVARDEEAEDARGIGNDALD